MLKPRGQARTTVPLPPFLPLPSRAAPLELWDCTLTARDLRTRTERGRAESQGNRRRCRQSPQLGHFCGFVHVCDDLPAVWFSHASWYYCFLFILFFGAPPHTHTLIALPPCRIVSESTQQKESLRLTIPRFATPLRPRLRLDSARRASSSSSHSLHIPPSYRRPRPPVCGRRRHRVHIGTARGASHRLRPAMLAQ